MEVSSLEPQVKVVLGQVRPRCLAGEDQVGKVPSPPGHHIIPTDLQARCLAHSQNLPGAHGCPVPPARASETAALDADGKPTKLSVEE